MKRILIPVCFALMLMPAITGCKGKGNGKQGPFPDNFSSMTDTQRVDYIMKNARPDSVARFICRAALGELDGARIDSLGVVTNYVYSRYQDDDVTTFGDAYDRFVEELPLAKKMRLRAMAGMDDPQGLGYELGLEYLGRIRDRNMTADEVSRELDEFRKACRNDTDTYRRFMIGFQVVLRQDSGIDIPKEIFDRFSDKH